MKKEILSTLIGLASLVIMGIIYHFVQDYEMVFIMVGVGLILGLMSNK